MLIVLIKGLSLVEARDAATAILATEAIEALHNSLNSGNCVSEQFINEAILKDPNFSMLETCGVLTVSKKSPAHIV